MLTWEPPPATGLGDRMGAWMVLLALGRLRNETVWLNWAPGWFRLPARIAADSQAALGCISFPSFARLQPEGGAAVRSIPLMWHKRQGGFAARPKPGVSVTARVRGGFNSVPHLMFGVWNRTDLLPPRSTAFTWRDYLHAYHEMAQLVRVRPACAPPIAQQQPAEPEEAAVEAAGTRLRMYVHLRRTDRGGEDDVRLGGAKGRGTRSRFEVQTHDAIRSLLEELTRQVTTSLTSTSLGGLASPSPHLDLTLASPSPHLRLSFALKSNRHPRSRPNPHPNPHPNPRPNPHPHSRPHPAPQLAPDGASTLVGDTTTGGSLAAAVECATSCPARPPSFLRCTHAAHTPHTHCAQQHRAAAYRRWVVLSDDMAHAHAALQLIANASVQAGARVRGVAHRAHAAPANHSTWNFFSFRGASGIVQSCIRDGWSSHSHVEKRRLGGGHPSNVGSRPFPVPALALLAPGGAPEPDERLRPHPARAGQRRRALASNPRLPQFVVSATPGPTRALLFSAYEWLLITPRSYSSIPALMWDVPLYSVRRYSCPCACACACPCACVCAWGLLWLAEFHLSIHLSGHKAFLGPEEVKGVTACTCGVVRCMRTYHAGARGCPRKVRGHGALPTARPCARRTPHLCAA